MSWRTLMKIELNDASSLNELVLFEKLKTELTYRYEIEESLASEMAFDLIEVMTTVDSNVEIIQKYFLVS